MDIWLTVVLVVHVIAAIGIIGLVLLQHGKGADMGAAFGSGSSGSLFGASGSANFLSRTTAILAAVFFLTSLSLAYLATHRERVEPSGAGVMDTAPQSQPGVPVPSTPAPAAPSADPNAKSVPVPQGADEKPKANDVPK
jgi:preprotein translocase subunit SecG